MMHYTQSDLDRTRAELADATAALGAYGVDPANVEQVSDIASNLKHPAHVAVMKFKRAQFGVRWISEHLEVEQRLKAGKAA